MSTSTDPHPFAPSGARETDEGWREFCTTCDTWTDEPEFRRLHRHVTANEHGLYASHDRRMCIPECADLPDLER